MAREPGSMGDHAGSGGGNPQHCVFEMPPPGGWGHFNSVVCARDGGSSDNWQPIRGAWMTMRDPGAGTLATDPGTYYDVV